jgi:cytochrome P450
VDALDYDPFSYATQEDPYPIYRRLREEAPAWWSEKRGFWALSRHADVFAALKDPARFSSRHGLTLEKGFEDRAIEVFGMLALDPPRHDRHRELVSKGFTPRRVAELEPRIAAIVDRRLDAVAPRGRCDFIADVAALIPMDVISELMGIPEADREPLRRLSDTVVHREEGSTSVSARSMQASLELRAYFAGWVADAKRRDREDLTATILRAEIDGERLSEQEVIGFLFLLVVAGHETTTHLLGNALYWLWRHPEERARVAADPALVPGWVDETLRFDTVTHGVARTLAADVRLHGRTLREGDRAMLLLASANRDERVFADPDVFDVRRDTSGLLSFGTGTHYCLGANLARLEARLALARALERIGDFEIDEAGLRRVRSSTVRGFQALPLAFAPGAPPTGTGRRSPAPR